MNNPIQKKTGKAIKWYGIEVFGKQILQIGITILLARLLEPEDFGLIGMVYIFVLVSSVIVDGGFAAALVYKKNIDSADKSTVFYTNIIISLLLYLLIFIFSESIASFYNQPQLKTIVRWLGLSIILASFNIVHYAMYSRKMNFKTPAKINLLALVISGTTAIIIALMGGRVWALVVQNIMMTATTVLAFWIYDPWKPIRIFRFKALKSLFSYGSNLMIAAIINQLFHNIYYVLIGKLYSPTALGYYSQANKIQSIPSSKIQQVMRKTTFPVFVSLSDQSKELENYFYKLFKTSALINFPALLLIALLSKDIVILLLTSKWEPIIPYLELLCYSSLFLPFFALSSNAVLCKGKSFLNLKIELLKNIIIILNIVIVIRWGILGLIIGQIINSILFLIIHLIVVKRILRIDIFKLLRITGQYLLIGFTPFLLIKFFMNIHSFTHLFNIILFGSLYIALYYLIALVFKLNNGLTLQTVYNLLMNKK